MNEGLLREIITGILRSHLKPLYSGEVDYHTVLLSNSHQYSKTGPKTFLYNVSLVLESGFDFYKFRETCNKDGNGHFAVDANLSDYGGKAIQFYLKIKK